MARTIETLLQPRDLREYSLVTMHVVLGMRMAALYQRAERDPLPDLAIRLRSVPAASAMIRLVETVDKAWPEKFLLRRPCCMTLSPDETLIAEITTAAAEGNPRAAAHAMRDMLPDESRRAIYRDTALLVGAIQAARTARVEGGE